MRIFRYLLIVGIWCFASAEALGSMTWSAIAVDPALVSRLKTDERLLEDVIFSDPPGQSVYLDKAWHGIHFLLTGSGEANGTLASKVIFGGESIGPDQGYGPAQLLSPSEVKAIATLLARETPERLASRYDPKALEKADIYPSVIWVREGQGALKYVLDYYVKLVAFYQRAAERGQAVVFSIH